MPPERRVRSRSRFALAAFPAALVLLLTGGATPATNRAGGAPVRASGQPQHKRSVAGYYASTLARGAPIAVLRRPTTLMSAPSWRSHRVARLAKRTEWGSPRVLAVVGRRGHWLRVIATELPNGRRGWISIRAVSLVANRWRMVADLSARRVTVFKRNRVVRRFPVAVGAPSTPTPTGRFAVTDKLELMGGSAAYGCCALALSGHQPHVAQGWTGGDRLAIHGTHQLPSIGQAASLGCLRARDEDARWVIEHVFLGTIVEIRP